MDFVSRPFALWITNAGELNVRRPAYRLSGTALGRAPEPGQALVVAAPFCDRLRTRFRGYVTPTRAEPPGSVSLLVEPITEFPPESLEGALLIEEGVSYRSFAARVGQIPSTTPTPARFDFGEDHGYGLVRIAQNFLDGILVGGGLGDRSFWDTLRGIDRLSGSRILRSDLKPLSPEAVWAMPTIRNYGAGEDAEWIVVRSAGPVELDEAMVSIDGDWRRAGVLQQASGRVTQLRVPKGPGEDVSHVIVPFKSAA